MAYANPDHTPGPWRIFEYEDHYKVTGADPGELVAIVPNPSPSDETDANAHLIASGPQLLALLEEAAIAVEGGTETEDDRIGLLKLMRTVIDAAHGRAEED